MAGHRSNTPNDRLVQRVRSLPKVLVQNALMRTGDRQIALSMMYMEDGDRAFVFSLLPQAKAKRVREELALQKRLRITYEQYRKAVEEVDECVGREHGGGSLKSYLRPPR